MKKAVITGVKEGGVIDVDAPHPRQHWAVVKVLAAPMCTEYKAYEAGHASAYLGHEAMGEVVDVDQSARVRPGDRVVVMPQYPCGSCALCTSGEYIHCEHTVDFGEFTNGGEGRATMAQYLLKPDWLLLGVPDAMADEHAAMACCGLGPTFGAMQRMGLGSDETLLITGLGPVGLGGVINGVHRGARVIAIDDNAWRRQRALDLGAECALAPDENSVAALRDLTGGRGVDRAIDCSGSPQAHRLCIDAVRRRGDVAFVGECSAETALHVSPDLIRKGIRLIGSWHYNLHDYAELLQTLTDVSSQLDLLISHRFPLERITDAWEIQLGGACSKIVLDPWAS